ncbi:uncharacterized protein [Amphiura filiformis]|uniref:uncharacterized protein n=1 Tax=Amphiura filiformis TaxID=82378 RepID=UPI003B20ECA0
MNRIIISVAVIALLSTMCLVEAGNRGKRRKGGEHIGGDDDDDDDMSMGEEVGRPYLHYDPRIWTFNQIFSSPIKQIYADPETNQLAGYNVDVVNEVCRIAGKNCSILQGALLDCWDNNLPQRALMGKWVDACMSFSHSSIRARSVGFTDEISPPPVPLLFTASGNPNNIDPEDLSDVNIGFLDAWWADVSCFFNVAEFQLPEDQALVYTEDAGLATIRRALARGQIDAIFMSNDLEGVAIENGLEAIMTYESCLLGGESIMTRKDSLLESWWNPAFEMLLDSPEYQEICDNLDDPEVHGNIPGRTAAEICIDYSP